VFSEEKERKERKRKRLWGIMYIFFCSLIFILCFYDKIIISIISISVHNILLYQASIPEPPALLTCAVQFFPLSTPLHPLTCQVAHTSCKALYILQGNVKYYCYLDNSHSYIAGISYSFPFPILCHPLMFTLCLCLTKEKSEIPKEMWEKKN